MPRRAKSSPDRWLHDFYVKAYCYNKDGMVYTCIDSRRQSTGFVWELKNKKRALALLEERRREKHEKKIVVTEYIRISEAFDKYLKVNKFDKEYIRKHFVQAAKTYFKFDYYLYDFDKIREMIVNVELPELSNNTKYKRLNYIRRFFNFCVAEGWMERNPVTTQMIPKWKDREVLTFKDSELISLLEHFNTNNKEMYLFIKFGAITGMRIQEVINLKWSDITEKEIKIHGKGDRPRIFPFKLFPDMIILLNELKQMNRNKVFSWLNQQTPAKHLRRALLILGIDERKTFHVIRKTVMNNWKKLGIPLEVRSLLAGNSPVVQYRNYMKSPDSAYFEQNLSSFHTQFTLLPEKST